MMNDDKYCVFRTAGETLGVPALSVRGITPAGEISRLPLAHESLVGMASIHREIVPVFDLSGFAGNGSRGSGAQVLVMNADSGPWGVLIDQVVGLETLEVSFNGMRPDDLSWSACCAGSASCGDEFVTVLDGESLNTLLADLSRRHWEQLESSVVPRDGAPSPVVPLPIAENCDEDPFNPL